MTLCDLIADLCGALQLRHVRHGFIAPLLVFIAAIWAGTHQNCYHHHHCHGPHNAISSWINFLLARTGPLVALPVVLLRLILLPYQSLEGLFRVDSQKCLEGTLLVWVLDVAIRVSVYMFVGPLDIMSDHIFLVASILPLVQIELVVAHWALETRPQHRGMGIKQFLTFDAVVPIIVGWIVIIALAYNCYITARFYHNSKQCWAAVLAGVPIFSGIGLAWIDALLAHDTDYAVVANAESGLKQNLIEGVEEAEAAVEDAVLDQVKLPKSRRQCIDEVYARVDNGLSKIEGIQCEKPGRQIDIKVDPHFLSH